MGILSQDRPPIPQGSQPRWERCERADLVAQSREVRTQGLAARHAAHTLQGPRPTRPAWRLGPATLARCPPVAAGVQSGPGRACFPRWVRAFHLACGAVGACGRRLGWLVRTLTGLDRVGAAASGAHQPVHAQGAHASVPDRPSAPARLSRARPPTDRTGPQAEPLPGGLCLVTMAPESHGMRVAQAAHARAHTTGHACRAPAWAPRTGRGIHAPREEAPGGVASVAHAREAHPSPDWLHGPPALVHAVAGPLAATARAAPKAISAAPAPLERLPPPSRRTEDEPQKRGLGRSPQDPGRLAPAAPALDAAWRAPVKARLRGRGPEDPGVDRERGGRRHGRLRAAAIQEPSEPRRPVAQPAGRRHTCLERLEPAERVLPTRRTTLECVARDVPPPVALAMPAPRLPSEDRARLAETRTVEGGTPLRAIAERLRPPLFEPGSVVSALRPAAHQQLGTEAKRLATVWQRSRAHGEGRTGSWSLRSQQRRGLDLPRTHAGFPTMHHVFLTRPDGTTAAQRFCGQKPRSMCAAIVASVALAPAPLRPPRKS